MRSTTNISINDETEIETNCTYAWSASLFLSKKAPAGYYSTTDQVTLSFDNLTVVDDVISALVKMRVEFQIAKEKAAAERAAEEAAKASKEDSLS